MSVRGARLTCGLVVFAALSALAAPPTEADRAAAELWFARAEKSLREGRYADARQQFQRAESQVSDPRYRGGLARVACGEAKTTGKGWLACWRTANGVSETVEGALAEDMRQAVSTSRTELLRDHAEVRVVAVPADTSVTLLHAPALEYSTIWIDSRAHKGRSCTMDLRYPNSSIESIRFPCSAGTTTFVHVLGFPTQTSSEATPLTRDPIRAKRSTEEARDLLTLAGGAVTEKDLRVAVGQLEQAERYDPTADTALTFAEAALFAVGVDKASAREWRIVAYAALERALVRGAAPSQELASKIDLLTAIEDLEASLLRDSALLDLKASPVSALASAAGVSVASGRHWLDRTAASLEAWTVGGVDLAPASLPMGHGPGSITVVRVALQPSPRPAPAPVGSLHVTGTPAGATVSVNGAPKGTLPEVIVGELTPGDVEVSVSLDGWVAERRRVEIVGNAPTALEMRLLPLGDPQADAPAVHDKSTAWGLMGTGIALATGAAAAYTATGIFYGRIVDGLSEAEHTTVSRQFEQASISGHALIGTAVGFIVGGLVSYYWSTPGEP